MSMSFEGPISVLVLGDDEAQDIAELLKHVQQTHGPGRDQRCFGCGEPWECHAWRSADQLALTYLIRGANQAYARAQATIEKYRRTA